MKLFSIEERKKDQRGKMEKGFTGKDLGNRRSPSGITRRVLRRTDNWIFGPEVLNERIGDVGDVVFARDWILDKKGEVRLYYSTADNSIGLATADLQDLLSFLMS